MLHSLLDHLHTMILVTVVITQSCLALPPPVQLKYNKDHDICISFSKYNGKGCDNTGCTEHLLSDATLQKCSDDPYQQFLYIDEIFYLASNVSRCIHEVQGEDNCNRLTLRKCEYAFNSQRFEQIAKPKTLYVVRFRNRQSKGNMYGLPGNSVRSCHIEVNNNHHFLRVNETNVVPPSLSMLETLQKLDVIFRQNMLPPVYTEGKEGQVSHKASCQHLGWHGEDGYCRNAARDYIDGLNFNHMLMSAFVQRAEINETVTKTPSTTISSSQTAPASSHPDSSLSTTTMTSSSFLLTESGALTSRTNTMPTETTSSKTSTVATRKEESSGITSTHTPFSSSQATPTSNHNNESLSDKAETASKHDDDTGQVAGLIIMFVLILLQSLVIIRLYSKLNRLESQMIMLNNNNLATVPMIKNKAYQLQNPALDQDLYVDESIADIHT
eukprot:m.31845 g.31845  ORF g.31845 m.31845 type:complete len:441 (-) comp8352_c0_seq2:47-1369(-)